MNTLKSFFLSCSLLLSLMGCTLLDSGEPKTEEEAIKCATEHFKNFCQKQNMDCSKFKLTLHGLKGVSWLIFFAEEDTGFYYYYIVRSKIKYQICGDRTSQLCKHEVLQKKQQ